MTTKKERMQRLLDLTIDALIEKIESGEATAADLQAARQLLKDNDIDISKDNAPASVKRLLDHMPDLDEPEDNWPGSKAAH